MRETIKDLLSKTIVFKYHLPNEDIKKTDLSTLPDKCFTVSSNKDLSRLIYNGIVEYAIGEKRINIEDLDLCQRKAIKTRLKYNEDATEKVKLRYKAQRFDFIFIDEIYKIDNQYIIDVETMGENERDVSFRVALFDSCLRARDILLSGPYISFPKATSNRSLQLF